ncbi:cell wall hydrolase [Sphingobium sp. HBC34]|uniref:Cell wall hydrolase n=1 Tax=Sphingobium cyanobacteriorum TaxID=3063954 RepID=A0ABT8ZJ69_9SPHN|nr:cell wall hydrolase [Sphingobium sp. HBC34]MDO7833830.1 cell wall hydrolase [Sphingobium sp. HBC34]
MGVAGWESRSRPVDAPARFAAAAARGARPAAPPPPVEPMQIYALPRDRAVAFNAHIPFSRDPNPAARPFLFSGTEIDLARATDCLAAAEIFEAGDDAVGQQAVAQVVLNRVRHPAFPKSVCGVVFQGQERRTGCQFTFTCDGALARVPAPAAWDRARAVARAALAGKVYPPVGHATHYHTDWVVPYWSGSLDKITAVGTHLFFRWRGWWGTPPAFRTRVEPGEPLIARIARFSTAHQDAMPTPIDAPPMLSADAPAMIAARPQQAIGAESLGKMVAGVRLIAIAPGARSFLVELPRAGAPDSWPALARTFCAGRAECRIMAWKVGSAPAGLPLGDAQLAAMSFAYIHNVESGLQRALWNCAQTPRTARGDCMRQRIPTIAPAASAQTGTIPPGISQTGLSQTGMSQAGLSGVRRKQRFETVTIRPPDAPPAP